MWNRHGKKLRIADLNTPIGLTFSKEPQEADIARATDSTFFLRVGEMRYHSIYVPSNKVTVTVQIKPLSNLTLSVYIRKGWRPTRKQYDLHFALPNFAFVTLPNAGFKENNNFSTRDPYEFDILPNDTASIGQHFIGIEINADSSNMTTTSVMENGGKNEMNSDVNNDVCVTEKPPPISTPPQDTSRQFNPKTDVNYSIYVTMRSCVFWDPLNDEWSARGCQVGYDNVDFIMVLSRQVGRWGEYKGAWGDYSEHFSFKISLKEIRPARFDVL